MDHTWIEYGDFGAYTCSSYQALFPFPREPGDEAKYLTYPKACYSLYYKVLSSLLMLVLMSKEEHNDYYKTGTGREEKQRTLAIFIHRAYQSLIGGATFLQNGGERERERENMILLHDPLWTKLSGGRNCHIVIIKIHPVCTSQHIHN